MPSEHIDQDRQSDFGHILFHKIIYILRNSIMAQLWKEIDTEIIHGDIINGISAVVVAGGVYTTYRTVRNNSIFVSILTVPVIVLGTGFVLIACASSEQSIKDFFNKKPAYKFAPNS